MRILSVLLFIVFVNPLVLAQEITISDQTKDYDLSKYLYIFKSKSRNLSFEDILSKKYQSQFKRNKHSAPAFSYYLNPIWIKFDIKNDSDTEDWVLHHNWALIDTVTLHYQENGKWKEIKTGAGFKFSERPMPFITFGYPLTLPKGKTKTFYLQSFSRTPSAFPLQLTQKERLQTYENTRNLFYGLYFGGLIIMILYNLSVFFMTKDNSYLYYILIIFSTLIIFSGISGYSFRYIWPNSPIIYFYSVRIMMTMIVVFSIFFTNSFLETKKNAPLFYKVFTGMLVVACIVLVYTILNKDSHVHNELIKIHIVLLMIVSVGLWVKRIKAARFYAIAWFFYLLGGMLITLSNTGALPINFITRHGVEIGSLIEVILLSIALGDKFRQYKIGEQLATQALLDKEKESTKVLEEKVKERTLELEERNEAIKRANKKLKVSLKELDKQKEKIEDQKEQIIQSIDYAKNIQQAILPTRETLEKLLVDYFVLFRPRDIVSGDFYYCAEKNNKTVFAVIDCTGHGVPGAFMSLIGNDLLNETILSNGILEPHFILDKLSTGVKNVIGRGEVSRNGMDISLIVIDKENKTVNFAGAKHRMVYCKSEKMEKIKGNKTSIGGVIFNNEKGFTKHTIPIDQDTSIYLFTDGYPDQFGGETNRKFRVSQLEDLLFSIHKEESSIQKTILNDRLNQWMGLADEPQIDDILLVGLKIKAD